MKKIFEPKIENLERKKWELSINEVRIKIKTLQSDITDLLFKMAENDVDHGDDFAENEKLKNRYVYERETSFRDEIIERIRHAGMNEKQISEFVAWHFLVGSTPEYEKHYRMDFEGDLSIVNFLEEKFLQLKSDLKK
ncbi:MAG: hypothetical protein WCI36_03915 [bacterium]